MQEIKKNAEKNNINFICNICDFSCSKESDYNRHIITIKHQNNINGNKKTLKNNTFNCEICKKTYLNLSGLWKHKKKCNDKTSSEINNNEIQNEIQNEINILTNKDELIIKLIKDNEEFKQLLKEQNSIISQQQKQNTELVQTIKEMTPKIGNTINNNCNNTTNNSFNLQLFLNETCKDAINLSDFIATIQFSDADLENSRKNGGISTLSNVMIKGLQQLDVTKRPVHCTDAKRETFYIKEQEKWEKDENHEKMMEAFENIAEKQRDYLWEWSEANPESMNVHHKLNDIFHHTNVKVLDPLTKKEQEGKKFIRNISKEVTIDKGSDK